MLAAFAALSLAPLAALLVRAGSRGATFAGPGASLAIGDQYRYLDWIRQASRHLLIAAPSGGHVYFNPVFLISGLLVRAGTGIQLAYQLWLPVAAAVLFVGYRAFVWRWLGPGRARPVALGLALMASSPFLPVLDYGGIVNRNGASHLVNVSTSLSPYWQVWGYFPTAIALGLMALFLSQLGDERPRPARLAALGFVVSLLDPWAGLTLVVLTVALRRSLRGPLLASVLPLIYYAALARVDPAWSLSQLRTSFSPQAWTLPIVFGPLLLGVWFARRDRDGDRSLLWLWLLVCALLFCVLGQDARLVALEGVSLPGSVLAVRGWRRLSMPAWVAALGIAVLLLPGAGYAGATLHDYVNDRYAPWTLAGGELQALHAAARMPAPLLTTSYLAPASYPLTGHGAYWTDASQKMFDDALSAEGVAALLSSLRPQVVVDDCLPGRARLLLNGYLARRYGCATLYRRLPSVR